MTRDELRRLLQGRIDREFVDNEILDRRPWIFETDAAYLAWQRSVADALTTTPANIKIVGSAATGFSLSPLKPGRPFRRAPNTSGTSDVDIAVLHSGLFEAAWNAVVAHDRERRLGGTKESRSKIRLDVYWGLVAQPTIPQGTDAARQLLTAMAAANRSVPIRGHPVRCRVYRRLEDLRAYHINSLHQLRVELLQA
jgi:hypothetical protein